MGEERHIAGTGGQYRGVGEGRHLVAEVGTADDGSRYPSLLEALCPADAHQRQSDGGDGGPRTARHDAHQGTDDTGGSQEDAGMDEFQTIVDHRGHDAAHHPSPAQGSDEEQDDEGGGHLGDVLGDGLFKLAPRHPGKHTAYHTADGSAHEQHHLTRTAQRVAAVGADGHCQHAHQHHQGGDREGNGEMVVRMSHPSGRFV